MQTLIRKVEDRLAGLPVPVALELPAGERVGPSDATVTLGFTDWSGIATLAAPLAPETLRAAVADYTQAAAAAA